MTLKQEEEQKKLLLLNDLNYIIESVLITLQNDFNGNLYNLYEHYLKNKYEIIENVFKKLINIKVETLQEIATQTGFKYEKVLIRKHNINVANEYQTRLLIDNLLKDKINELIKEHKQDKKRREYLEENFNNNDNKAPPTNKNDFVVLCNELIKIILIVCSCIIAFISGLCKGTKKRR